VDDVVSLADLRAGDRVLEVGCGTGKATVPFASRNFKMLCLEPSEPMASVARRNCEPFRRVAIRTVSLEDWAIEPGAFRLVMSAQAWHWISPEVRLQKVHRALETDGVLAVFWNTVEWRDEQLRAEIDDLYERAAPDLAARRPGLPGTRGVRYVSIQELEDSTLFSPVTERRYPWTETYTTARYLELLTTHSDHRMLRASVFDRLAQGLTRIIGEAGGEIRVDYVARLHLARRRDGESC
jgi:SAM-dependent methyltransferase